MVLLEEKRKEDYKMNKAQKYSLIKQLDPYILKYFPEQWRFLYSGLYVIRKERMKRRLRVHSFTKDIVLN